MRRAFAFVPFLAAIGAATVVARRRRQRRRYRSLETAQAAGWDCNPMILIGGHYHCSPPGKPSVQDIVDGTATAPSVVHQVFRPNGAFAGTETLIRADLFAGQRCPTDQWLPVPPWLPEPTY